MAKKEENEENICHWNACGTQFDTAETLFNHVCSTHIGRKSAGTLSLECKWTGCHAKASKRDHLTSHCRVHIALKPHVCSICTKAFKRPQDLKKHEKIHSEDHHTTYKSHKAAVAAAAAAGTAVPGAPGFDPAAVPPVTAGAPAAPFTLYDAKGNPVPQVAYPFGMPGFGYPYQLFPGQQQPGMQQATPNPADPFAQLVALQSQLNAQAAQASGFPAISGLGLQAQGMQMPQLQQLQQNAYAMLSAGGLQLLPQAGVFPFGNAAFAFSAPPTSQPHLANVPTQPGLGGIGALTPPSTSSPPQPATSIYPTIPTSLYPTASGANTSPASMAFLPSPAMPLPQHLPPVKQEGDLPSPANSARSGGAYNPKSSPYSSSLSPSNVPALSPPSLSTPEHSYSPSPELDGEYDAGGHARRYSSTNQVAGKKRAFDEAAGAFLGDLQNKRFQDADSVNAQLDALSSFLLTPEMSAGVVGVNGDDSASSAGGSDYGAGSQSLELDQHGVDSLNQLLFGLNQGLDDPSAVSSSTTTPGAALDLHGALNVGDLTGAAPAADLSRPIAGLPSSASLYGTATPSSLYPSLPTSLAASSRPSAPAAYPTLSTLPPLPNQGWNAYAQPPTFPTDPLLKLSKPAAAPTLANDYRATQYHHMARLQRAAPSATEQQEQQEAELDLEGMDVDDDVKDAAAALLMGKLGRSFTAPAPTGPAAGSSKPTLPSLSTALGGPRLPGATAGRLPGIKDLLSFSGSASPPRAAESGSTSPTSPSASFSFTASPAPTSSASASSSPSLYPSLSALAPSSSSRPVSAGGVERLTHRVHKLRLPSTADEPERERERVLESEADLSASSGDESDDADETVQERERRSRHRDKKSRVEGPAVVEEEEEEVKVKAEAVDEDELDELKEEKVEEQEIDEERRKAAEAVQRRRATLAYLVMYINAKYRADLARKGVKQVRKAIKSSGPAPPSALKQEIKAE
ncbi:hypothetical protein JCM10207_005142 [Rhodosporidiobolus poonsookiae]